MGRKCVARECQTGTDQGEKTRGGNQPPMFTCPAKGLLPAWQKAVPLKGVSPKPLSMQSTLCARHFDRKDVITHDKVVLTGGNVHYTKRGRPKLAPNAVPCRFGEAAGYDSTSPSPPSTPLRQTPEPAVTAGPSSEGQHQTPTGSTPRVVPSSTPKSLPGSTPRSVKVPPRVPPPPLFFDKTTPKSLPLAGSSSTPRKPQVPFHTPRPLVFNSPSPAAVAVPTTSNSPPDIISETEYMREFHSSCRDIKLPRQFFWALHTDNVHRSTFIMINKYLETEKIVELTDKLLPKVMVIGKPFPASELNNKADLEALLWKVDGVRVCKGFGEVGEKITRSDKCTGYLPLLQQRITDRCTECASMRVALQKKNTQSVNRIQKLKKKVVQRTQRVRRLVHKVQSLQEHMQKLMKDLCDTKKKTVDDILSKLPPEQQEMVTACFEAAKHENKKGRRYTVIWIYDCILMKIKSPALYRKLREENKLALPSDTTIKRYIQKASPAYGFQESTFAIMQKKAEHMSIAERHGCLLLDEMALDGSLKFDPSSLKVTGLVDLSKFTLEEHLSKIGDHALVVMYQPFRGRWVQALGAFLSAGAVKGDNLQKIVLEAVLLLEGHGFYVDCVTTDGATWNRAMWRTLGVNLDKNYMQHPMDPERNLFFGSDFPHVVKNLWTRVLEKKVLHLPEGTVKLAHWYAVYELEVRKGIKADYIISIAHLEPTNYQKMKVRLAMQFFGQTIATTMRYYKTLSIPELQDCDATVAFIERINKVQDAMNSQVPWESLKADPESTHHKVLLDFLEYLNDMEELAKVKESFLPPRNRKRPGVGGTVVGHEDELSAESFIGLQVTVKTALGLISYLSEEVGYQYLMTRRINQDSLEHFFGHVRGACGSNTHPDPQMFINVYRLLSTSSLIKPPRGSNVSGGEMLQALLDLKDLQAEERGKRRSQLEERIDALLDGDMPPQELLTDHDYLEQSIDVFALTVFGGYVSRKVRKMTPASKCHHCFAAVCASDEEEQHERETLLQLRDRGGLLRPSIEMFELLFQLEQAVLRVSSTTPVHATMLFSILDKLSADDAELPLLGCDEHKRGLTSAIISFFLRCRMHFICAEANRAIEEKKKKKRDMAKKAKLG